MPDPIQVIDTFKLSKAGIHLKKYHIQRTLKAFAELEINVNEFSLRAIYQQIEDKNINLESEKKAKITFDSVVLKNSVCQISEVENLPTPITVELAKNVFQISGRGLQNFKISRRNFWDQLLKSAHCFDVIGINQEGYVTETSRFNIFLFKNNICVTPTLDSGCIQGAYRSYVLDLGYIEINQKKIPLTEKDVMPSELKNYDIYVGNSLRGLHKAVLI